MTTLVVTSRVTYVPANYETLVAGLSGCPQVSGLVLLDNRQWGVLLKGLALMAMGARRIGRTLVRNWLFDGAARRCRHWRALGKSFRLLADINSPDAVEHVRARQADLVLNARTRHIYREPVLATPPLGCINVHHGLLPEQRGTMCDLWALYEGGEAGFSIHVMTAKIDAGAILARVPVSDPSERDYLAHLARSAVREQAEVRRLLEDIDRAGMPAGKPNAAPPGLKHRRNPTRAQIRGMRRGGLRL